MIRFKTKKHHMLVLLPGLGSSGFPSVEALSQAVDSAVDELHAVCSTDAALLAQLEQTEVKSDAVRAILLKMPGATFEQRWMRDFAGPRIAARVLYLLCPSRFGFQVHGWLH